MPYSNPYPDGPSDEWSDEEESEIFCPPDPLVIKFGDESLVKEIREFKSVRGLLSEGVPIIAEAVFAAIESLHMDTLVPLLETGASPNMRSRKATPVDTAVSSEWSTRDVTPNFANDLQGGRGDWRQWYPIQFAAHAPIFEYERDRRAALMGFLLEQNADPYALFIQPLRRAKPFPFPGDEYDSERDPGEADINDVGLGNRMKPPRLYGARSVVHSILEDGGCAQPFFDGSGPVIDLERRDPQGRTIFLSACRSGLGADSVIDGVLQDVYWDTESGGGFMRDPFVSSDEKPSLFHTLRLRKADLLAVDHSGKHALHHLLEAQDPNGPTYRPPTIKNALGYVLAHLKSLANQPDNYGTYPLHTALQRWRRYSIPNQHTMRAGLESTVEDLLAVGANPLERDGRGNTALHYIADTGLAEQHTHGDYTRRVFQLFVDHGVDINARNKSGRTALELFLDDDGVMESRRMIGHATPYGKGDMPSIEDLETEAFGLFEKAGVRWTETDPRGRTLLHIVARHPPRRAILRAKFLLARGVDPMVKDKDGKTAFDVASNSPRVLDALSAEMKS